MKAAPFPTIAAALTLSLLLRATPADAATTDLATLRVDAGHAVSSAVKAGLVEHPMFVERDDAGRLLVTETLMRASAVAGQPRGRIRRLEDTDGDGVYDSSTVFADEMDLPMGVLAAGGEVYATTATRLLRLRDEDGDGHAETVEVIHEGWTARGAEGLHGPFRGPDGGLYLTQGRASFEVSADGGRRLKGRAARVWRCEPDGSRLEVVAGGGFSNPVELAFTAAGEIVGTASYVTPPLYGERDGLIHFVVGGVYGLESEVNREFKTTGPTLEAFTRFAAVGPAGLLCVRGDALGTDRVGQLFSAQTDAGRVQRHELTRTNGTFACADADFLHATAPNFNPTDLVEDDRGLIVVDAGEPGASVGGLIRITRIGHVPPPVEPAAKPSARSRRPRVIAGKLHGNDDDHERLAALWQLHADGGPVAREAVHDALLDRSPAVRTGAANSVGLHHDSQALESLHELVIQDPDAGVRRAAATALGRIGEVKSNGPLVRAAAAEQPRFVEHAIIHSLVGNYGAMTNRTLKYSLPQLRRLQPGSARAAAIAFDQMDPSPLRPEHLLPLFNVADTSMQRTAGWVFNRHPEWFTNIVGHLQQKLLEYSVTEAELASMRALFSEFSNAGEIQNLMAEAYSNKNVAEDRRKILFEVMRNTELDRFPGRWISALKVALVSEDTGTSTAAFDMIERHNLAGFEDFIAKIADTDERDDIRFRAFSLLAEWDELSNQQTSYLFDQLEPDPKASPTRRIGAARALSRAKLTPADRTRIINDFMPAADVATLPILLESFRGETNANVGRVLVESLLDQQKLWRRIRPRLMAAVVKQLPDDLQAESRLLVGKIAAAHQDRLDALQARADLLKGGEIGNGRRVFFAAGCADCHRVGPDGADIGPDLSLIGRRSGGLDILESIIQPDTRIVPGFETYRVETGAGTTSGLMVEETAERVVLRLSRERTRTVAKEKIETIRAVPQSLMPGDVADDLDEGELRDLLAFLQSLRGR